MTEQEKNDQEQLEYLKQWQEKKQWKSKKANAFTKILRREKRLKRRTDTRRSPAEIKSDSQRHYGEMAECAPNPKVREDFKRPVYQVARLIRKQGESLHETPDE